MLLFVDTETSDMLKRHLPLSDESQPWIVSIAAELVGMDGVTQDFFYTRVRAADGAKIRDGAEKVHGISSREASRSGVPQVVALGMLCHFAAQANLAIGFGMDFDRQIVESALIRSGKDTKLWVRPGLQFVNCMLAATPVCKLPPKQPRDDGAHKWPSLDEACEIILGTPRREGHHNAWNDMQRTKLLYFALRAKGVLEIAA